MTDSITQLDCAENMIEGETNQHMKGKIRKHNLSTKGGDSDSGGGAADGGGGDADGGGGDADGGGGDADGGGGDADGGGGDADGGGGDADSGGGDADSGGGGGDADSGGGGGDADSGGGDADSGGGGGDGDADSGGGGGDADSGDADSGNSDKEKEHCTDKDQGVDKSQDENSDGGVTEIKEGRKSTPLKHIKSLNIEQPEDTVTEGHKQQKENTAAFSGQSDGEQEDRDSSDGKCNKVKNENNELLHARDQGSRLRKPKKQHNLAQLGKDDIHSHVETTRRPVAADTFSWHILCAILLAFLVLLSAVLWFLRNPSPPVQKQYNLLEVFDQKMNQVQASFPSQHRELWRRSRIHVKKHLNLTAPTEPVSLILTSGREAEKTLGCLAQQLAAAFSNTLNSSVLSIDGTSKSAQNSDDVKLEIDEELKKAFEGGTQAAVIHRFEELPPGSTLIFYRYCDHENSAFKKVFLAFTVMLQEEMFFPPNVSLVLVEGLVQEYLKERFVSSDRTAKFNQMDLDKLSGLWSRISHLILPVAAEQTIEQHGCPTLR